MAKVIRVVERGSKGCGVVDVGGCRCAFLRGASFEDQKCETKENQLGGASGAGALVG